jgi:hypothetical protein
MPLIHLNGHVTDPAWEELDRKLRGGDGLQWTGDPDLWLGIGVITRGTQEVARRLEVWRHCEDGEDRMIGSWHPGEAFRVCYDLAGMRADRPNAVPVIDQIDQHNAKLEQESETKAEESLAAATEHAAKLWHDTNEPRTVFRQVGGMRDNGTQE